jgi:hypothetical protein
MLVDARDGSKARVPPTYENILAAPRPSVRKMAFLEAEAVAEVA